MIWKKFSYFLSELYSYLFGYLVYHKTDFKAMSLIFALYTCLFFLLVCQWQQHAFCITKIHTRLGLASWMLHECSMSMLCHLSPLGKKTLIKYIISQSSCVQALLIIMSPHVYWMQVEHVKPDQDFLVRVYSISVWNRKQLL